MKLEYIPMGEQLIPNLTLKDEGKITLGKYALMRKHYLKEHRPIQFTNYLTTQTLNQHLMEIDQIATQRHDLLLEQMMKQQGSERSVERIQSDGMDSKDEQYRGNDSRNSPSRTDLRLEETQSTGNPFGIPAFYLKKPLKNY